VGQSLPTVLPVYWLTSATLFLVTFAETTCTKIVPSENGNFLFHLNDSVHAEVTRFGAATGIRCHCALNAPTGLPLVQQETILRTVGEGLANIARHAQADQLGITCVRRGKW
jgi:signal transduction histidine kinase